MFDARNLYKKTMVRTGEIEADAKRAGVFRRAAIAMVGICAMCAVAILLISPFGGAQEDFMMFEDDSVPLSSFAVPQVEKNTLPITGMEKCVSISGVNGISVNGVGADIVLFNPEGNNCNYSFEIVLGGTNETLYESGLVEPGRFIDKLSLNKQLEKGEHDVEMIIRFFDTENFTFINSAVSNFTLIIE